MVSIINRFRILSSILLITVVVEIAKADSTGTVISPTQEQLDWQEIYSLDSDIDTALELSKSDIKFDKYYDKIIDYQARITCDKKQKERNVILNRGYYGHIYYYNTIVEEKKKIKTKDGK